MAYILVLMSLLVFILFDWTSYKFDIVLFLESTMFLEYHTVCLTSPALKGDDRDIYNLSVNCSRE